MSTTSPQKPSADSAPVTPGTSVKSVRADEPPRDALASLRIDRTAPRVERKRGRWIRLILIVALFGGGGYFGYRYVVQGDGDTSLGNAAWMPEIMQNRVDVRLESVEVQKGRSADAVVVATGYLRSHRQAGIGARSPGRIDVVNFEEGDQVTKGQVLAELDHKDLDASLAAARATVARAKAALGEQEIVIKQADADRARAEKLRTSRSIADSEYDQFLFAHQSAVARLESLKAELALAEAGQQQAEQVLENMFIRAPFDGTVISKDAEEGESILPGGTGGTSGRGSVATIADLSRLEIECDVQEGFISRVNIDQQADIAVDAVPDKKYHGVVQKIIPMGDRARATIKVRVEITDADKLLFPEMSGTVFFLPPAEELQAGDEPRMFVPSTSVDANQVDANQVDAGQVDAGQQRNAFVWVVDAEKRAQQIVVQAGEERDGRTEILSGLTGRERVVVNPEKLRPGTPVAVVE